MMQAFKFLCSDALSTKVSEWRESHLRVGFTCGAFDLLHAGHVNYLERARSLCDRLIVAVNSDSSIRSYKGVLRPVISEEMRSRVIGALACVDAVTVMADSRPTRLIQILKPDLYIKGGDYQKDQLKSAPLVEEYGGRCVVIPVEHEISTSAIMKRIEELSMYAAAGVQRPTGRPLILLDRDGTVIENVPFLNTPARVKLLEGVGESLRSLQEQRFELVIVTNQQGLGLGYFDYDAFVAVNSEMLRQLGSYGVRISKFYFCPHSLAEDCECRKPRSEMIRRAISDFGSRAEDCYLMGDSQSDLLAAQAAGCRGLLVGNTGLSFAEATKEILSIRTSGAAIL